MEEPYGGEDSDQLKHVLISSDKKLLGDKEDFFRSVNKHVLEAKSDEEENSADVLIFIHGYWSLLMAHNLGSRALIDALKGHFNDLKITDNPHRLKPISHVVFAAADEEVSKFIELVLLLQEFTRCSKNQNPRSITRPVPTVTVYSNREDRALTVSHIIHFEDILVPKLDDTRSCRKSIENKKLGLKTPDFVDVMDATSVGISTFQHSYYCEIQAVLNDLKAVLRCRRAKERADERSVGKTIHAFHLDNQLGTTYEFVKDKMTGCRVERFTSNLFHSSGSGSH